MGAVGKEEMQSIPQHGKALIQLLNSQGSQAKGSILPLWELLSAPRENPGAVSHGAQPGSQHAATSVPSAQSGRTGAA